MGLDEERFNETIEVFRTSHELSARHGRNASAYAEQLQTKAEADGRPAEAEFWARVAAALRSRS